MFNLNVFIILFLGFIDYFGIGLVYPIFGVMLFDPADPIIAAEASSTYRGAILGILMGLTPLSAFLFAPFLGSFSDSEGRKKTLLFGMAAGTLGYILAIVGIVYHSLSLLFIFRILVGITEGSAAVAQAALADISTESNKARRFSLFSSSAGLGFTIGPFIGGKLGDPGMNFGIGYVTPFILAGILCLVNSFMVWAVFPESRNEKKRLSFNFSSSLRSLGKVFTWSHLIWLFATCFCLSFAWSFFNEFMPVMLRANFLFSLNEVGNYFAWGGIWYSVSSGLFTAPLLRRFTPEKLLMAALGGSAATMMFFSKIEESEYIWMTLPVLMFFLSLAFPTLMSLVSNRAHADNQGEVLGVFHSVQGCAMGLSPILGGALIGTFPALVGWGGGWMMFLGCFALWIGCKKSSALTLEKVE